MVEAIIHDLVRLRADLGSTLIKTRLHLEHVADLPFSLLAPRSILYQIDALVQLLRDGVYLRSKLLFFGPLLQNALLLLQLLLLAGLHRVLARLLKKLQRLRVDLRMVQVLLGHLFFHDGALQIFVPPLFMLYLVLHELLHGSYLYLAVLRFKLPLQRHLRHLISLLHLVLVLYFLGSLMLRLDSHGVVMQAAILILNWIGACSIVPFHFLLVLYYLIIK